MSDRFDFYFRQKVTESELDGAFNALELADLNFVIDADLTGIHYGLGVAQQGVPNLSVAVAAGGAYDTSGRRVRSAATQTVDCSVDYNAISTAVASAGNERWLSIFVGFTRNLTDPRTDGNSLTVYFSRAEAFAFRVVAGAEAAIGSAARPSLDAARVLLADVRLINAQTTILAANIDITRRQDLFVINGARKGRTKEAVTELAAQLATHIASATAHPAAAITYAGGTPWADTTTNPATTVEAQLDKVVADLAGSSGTAKLGGAAVSSANGIFPLASGTLAAQLTQIAGVIDSGPLGMKVSVYSGNATLTTERQVYVDTSGGAVTITLPAPTSGRQFFLKDKTGSFDTNACTLAPAVGTTKIEGIAGSRALGAGWGSYRVHSDGTDWYID